MGSITVVHAELEALSSKLGGDASTLQDLLTKIQNEVDAVQGAWVGAGQQAFQATMAEWQSSSAQIMAALGQVSTLVNNAATVYSDTDSQVSSSFTSAS